MMNMVTVQHNTTKHVRKSVQWCGLGKMCVRQVVLSSLHRRVHDILLSVRETSCTKNNSVTTLLSSTLHHASDGCSRFLYVEVDSDVEEGSRE